MAILYKKSLPIIVYYARISTGYRHMYADCGLTHTDVRGKRNQGRITRLCGVLRRKFMDSERSGYYIVKQKALPEVLLKVVEAKQLLDREQALSVAEATERVGISRSSFYKYKDDIFRFHDDTQGTTVTLTFNMDDEPGLLSDVLKTIADAGANILTIHQSIPIGGVASLTISIQVLENTGDISEMIEHMEGQKGVHHVRISAKG